MIVLDTNAVIYYLQGDKKCIGIIEHKRKRDSHVAISTITEVEALSFPKLDDMRILLISAWLNTFSVIPLDSALAREAARLRRFYRLKSPDAIVAATALFYDAILITRDKGFRKIDGLRLVAC